MNDIKVPKITPKKLVLFLFCAIFLYVIYWVVAGYSQQTLGLSGGVASYAPRMDSALSNSGGYSMKNIAINESADSYSNPTTPPLPTATAPASVSKIIKTGSLSLLVKNVDDTALAIQNLRIALLGQPGNANFSEYGNGGKSGNITIWVPSDKFDGAMASIKALALRVNTEQVTVQDVSAQFVDLESRLRNLKSAEVQYQEVMKRSGKISEVLEVTRALNDTRSQIEMAQGQLDYLSRQVALSSISVSLSQDAIPGSVVSNEWRPLSVAKTALKQTLGDLTNFIDLVLVFLIKLPVLLLNIGLWVLIAWMLWKGSRFAYHRMMGASTSVSPKNVV